MRRRRCAAGLLLALGAAGLAAQAPLREEQFVYSIVAFNGRDYSATFARREAPAIYLLAEVDNFITARNRLVYFWPITGEWMLDRALDVAFAGTLELSGRGRPQHSLGMTPYTYFNVRGEYEQNWQVATGAEAAAAVRHARGLTAAYYQAIADYRRERQVYEQVLERMAAAAAAMRAAGKDVTRLAAELEQLAPPPEPQPPAHYAVPPVPVRQAFVINLPAGEYRIRLRTAAGEIMEGSERRVVTFAQRRAEAVGLEVIPGDKWTRPVESTSPASVLYVDGSTDLYLRPFYQQEYNDLFYEKMRRNDAKGNPHLMKWVRIQQVPGAALEVAAGTEPPRAVRERPFFVEQLPGAALGYRIVPFDPAGRHAGREPSLRAFHLPAAQQQAVLRVRVLDRSGRLLPSGERQVRVVAPSARARLALLLAALPLLALAAVLLLRARRVAG